MISVEEVAVAQDEVDDGVFGIVGSRWVPAEDVVDRASVVQAGGDAAVAVLARLAAWPA